MAHQCTYFPKAQAVYAGSYEDISSVMAKDYLASLKPDESYKGLGLKPGLTAPRYAEDISTGDIPRVFERLGEQFERNFSLITRVASLRKAWKEGSINAMQLNKLNQLSRLADVNDQNIFQITIVQFIDSILGEIENDMVVTRAATHIPLNGLRGKIPEGGWITVDMQVDRMNEPNIQQNQFGQTEVRIKRNDIHMYMAKEDRMEATIDPYAWNLMQAQKNRLQARDLQALVALSGIQTGFTSGTGVRYNSALNAQVINDPTEQVAGGGVFPRARYDIPGEILDISERHFTKYRNKITRYVMNVNTYRALETNWYAYRDQKPPPPGASGIIDFPGGQAMGIKAIVSWWAPEGILYGLGPRGFYEFDGPMNVDTSFDQAHNADFTSIRDFIGYFIVNSHRYCEKIAVPIAGKNTVAVGAGQGGITEITTFSQVEKMLAQPDDTGSFKIVQQSDNP